jgi:hydrogenase maturation protease
MKIKLLAMGNVLMGDDGIAVYMAGIMEEDLRDIGIEVIYGETDIGYCLNQIGEGDYIILFDASDFGKEPGDITTLTFEDINFNDKNMTHHSISFLDLVRLYFPKNDGIVITVQTADISLRYGISSKLTDKTVDLSQELLKQLMDIRDRTEIA